LTPAVSSSAPVEKTTPRQEPAQDQELLPTLSLPTKFAPPEPQTGKAGEVIQSGDITLFVMGWDNVTPMQYLNPDPGCKFISIAYVVVNSGDSPIALHSFSFYLKDATGQKYEQAIGASMAVGGGIQSVELSSGERLWISQGFQVSEAGSDLQFIFESLEQRAGKIFVDLGAEPGLVQAPTSLPGEKALQNDQPNQPVMAGGLVITVNVVSDSMEEQYIKPRPGNKFVIVDVTIENQSSANIKVMIYAQMALKDSQGRLTFSTPSALMESNEATPDGDLIPGEKIRGKVGFEVLEDASGLVLMFDEDIFQPPPKVSIALPTP